MNKHIFRCVASVAILLGASSAYASDSSFNGFYLGAEGGAGLGYFSESSNSTLNLNATVALPFGRALSENFTLGIPADATASNLSGFVGAHIGVGHVFKRFYLGVEGNGDLGQTDTSTYAPPSNEAADLAISIKNEASLKNVYGITLRPGFLITPTLMLYAQLGVERANANMSNTTIFSNGLGSGGLSASFKTGTNQDVLGYRAGFGIEKHTSEHWSVRAEYLFTDFNALSSNDQVFFSGSPAFLPSTVSLLPTSNLSESAHVSPYFHSVMLGVTYYV